MTKPRKKIVAEQVEDVEVAQSDDGGSYFTSDKPLAFCSSGSTLLDQVLGGGWVLGRIGNIVGDRSSGKSLLAIEACANFNATYPDGVIRYCEAEAAFDVGYAEALGMPTQAVDFADTVFTIEELSDDIEKTLDKLQGRPALYIVDSLDALSDKAEQEREIGDSSYGASKAKKLGELFRRLVKRIESSKMCLLIISQIRDNIGVTFGETKMRTGGRSLDFYASQVIWLAQVGQVKKTINKIERPIGVDIVTKNKKNKIGLPFRDCRYTILFGYGVEDVLSMVEWLLVTDPAALEDKFGLNKTSYKTMINRMRDNKHEEYVDLRKRLQKFVIKQWRIIESGFLPKSKKY